MLLQNNGGNMIEELKKWLRNNKTNFVTEEDIETSFGYLIGTEVVDMDALDSEIDAFVADFEAKRKQKKETN